MPTQIVKSTALDQLHDLEHRIEQNIGDTNRALTTIHDEGLYKADGFTSFKTYVEQRWGYSKSHAHRMIDHTRIVEHLKAEGVEVLPANEGQTRPLLALKRKAKNNDEFLSKASEAWRISVDTAPEKFDVPNITGQHVEATLQQFGISRSYAKPKDAVLEDFRRRLSGLIEHRYLKDMTGDEFIRQHGSVPKLETLVVWLVDAHQEELSK